MEVYFKELISKEASLDKLVDDLQRVVQGADDLAKSLGTTVAEHPEIARRVQQLKERCERLSGEIIERARATDRFVRKHPHSFVAGALLAGVLTGVALARK